MFPKDPVDDIARDILQSNEIDREILEVCLEEHVIFRVWHNQRKELHNLLERHGYNVTDKVLSIGIETRRQIIEQWNSKPPLTPERVKTRFCAESINPDDVDLWE